MTDGLQRFGTKAFKAAIVLMALPLIVPVELSHRALYPEVRWTKYAATYELHRHRRGLPTNVDFGDDDER